MQLLNEHTTWFFRKIRLIVGILEIVSLYGLRDYGCG